MIVVRLCTSDAEIEQAFSVRRAVFIEEQGVPESLEHDTDDATAYHFLLTDADSPIGAARLLRRNDTLGKVGRVAILATRRSGGLGRTLMDGIEAEARSHGFTHLYLHAQTPVVGFYERLGWQAEGDEFYEADIPHYKMSKTL
ncbi:MAG: GNAT family N-acetyltransferase [Armatimonas sp.]